LHTAEDFKAAFEAEKQICRRFVQDAAADGEFLDRFSDADTRQAQGLAKLLASSRIATAPSARYILAHPGYFEVDVDMHGDHLAFVPDEGIYCEVTTRRLEEAEALRASRAAWEIRKDFLEGLAADLNMPWDEVAYGTEIATLTAQVRAAQRVYHGSELEPDLNDFVLRTVRSLEERRPGPDEVVSAEQTKADVEELHRRVGELRSLAKAGGEPEQPR
jgi:hypothetical protein